MIDIGDLVVLKSSGAYSGEEWLHGDYGVVMYCTNDVYDGKYNIYGIELLVDRQVTRITIPLWPFELDVLIKRFSLFNQSLKR